MSKKRNLSGINKSDLLSSGKQTCLLPDSVRPQDVIILPNGKRVTLFCDWTMPRPVTVATKFVNTLKVDEGRFILLQDDRTEVLDDESEAIHWVIEARKHKRASAPKSAIDEQRSTLGHADIIIIPSDDRVTLYSDWMKQRPNTAAPQFISQVQNEGGKFVLLEGGLMEFLNEEREMMRWVMEARKQSEASSFFSSNQETQSDIIALIMTKEALKGSKPDVKGRYTENMGGTTFKPEIGRTQIYAFIQRANKLKNRSDVALYKLLNELDDEEDVVHLYRNFHDEKNIFSESSNIWFSRREVDILAYSTLYGIDWDFTWNLMPYRNRKEFYKLYCKDDDDDSMQRKLKSMLKDRSYVQHLNQHVSQLFEEL